jgi:hypothetical protein
MLLLLELFYQQVYFYTIFFFIFNYFASIYLLREYCKSMRITIPSERKMRFQLTHSIKAKQSANICL